MHPYLAILLRFAATNCRFTADQLTYCCFILDMIHWSRLFYLKALDKTSRQNDICLLGYRHPEKEQACTCAKPFQTSASACSSFSKRQSLSILLENEGTIACKFYANSNMFHHDPIAPRKRPPGIHIYLKGNLYEAAIFLCSARRAPRYPSNGHSRYSVVRDPWQYSLIGSIIWSMFMLSLVFLKVSIQIRRYIIIKFKQST